MYACKKIGENNAAKIFFGGFVTESLVTYMYKHKRESRALTDVEQPPADNIRQTGDGKEL